MRDRRDAILVVVAVDALVRVRTEGLDHAVGFLRISGLFEICEGILVTFWIVERVLFKNFIFFHLLLDSLVTLCTYHFIRRPHRIEPIFLRYPRCLDIPIFQHIMLRMKLLPWQIRLHIDISERPPCLKTLSYHRSYRVFTVDLQLLAVEESFFYQT